MLLSLAILKKVKILQKNNPALLQKDGEGFFEAHLLNSGSIKQSWPRHTAKMIFSSQKFSFPGCSVQATHQVINQNK